MTAPASLRPLNLLFITLDEMRGDCLAANGLNPDIRTPCLDRFAAEGVRLARHFTPFPKCVPARAALTTGRYCHTDGFRDIHYHLPASSPDLLSSLLSAGYEIALFGKNHCWDNIFEATHTPPQLPPGQTGHRIAHHSWTAGYDDIYRATEAALAPPPTLRAAHRNDPIKPFETHWADEAYTRQAEHFLRTRPATAQPFYLHVNLEAPHPPYCGPASPDAPDAYDPSTLTPFPYDLPEGAPLALLAQHRHRLAADRTPAALRRIQAAYYSMITRADAQVGRILTALDAAGLRDSTVVLVTSDHGDFAGQYGLPEKWDTVFTDCLLHVPALLRGPGLPSARVHTGLSDHTDLAPTLAELLSIPLPSQPHGRSLLPTLRGETPGRDAVFATGGHEPAMRARIDRTTPTGGHYGKFDTYQAEPDSMARAMCVRTAHHKLVWRETGDHELYLLDRDPWELCNRYADPTLAALRADLMARLLDWQLATWTDRPFRPVVGP